MTTRSAGRARSSIFGALDVVYAGVIEAHRKAIGATEELDPVTQDMLIAHSGQLEQFHWFVRAHLKGGRLPDHRKRPYRAVGGQTCQQALTPGSHCTARHNAVPA